ncbi:hypothetical protein CEXT_723921 [Caerostris extrusa]|uniref:Uncharacterized protein n=1 Tax=Caerostris extrusa TaxID=172846 RepID=A0AAV4TWG5_CAEEX|nr:hypothetical protein CEXT_723921 [Caerostris extrusa]
MVAQRQFENLIDETVYLSRLLSLGEAINMGNGDSTKGCLLCRRSDCDDDFDRETKYKEQKKRHNRDDRDDDLPKRYRRYSSSAERNIYHSSPDGRRSRYKESFNRDNWTVLETGYGCTAPRDFLKEFPTICGMINDKHGDLEIFLDQRKVFLIHMSQARLIALQMNCYILSMN